jgi:hypothetical protein
MWLTILSVTVFSILLGKNSVMSASNSVRYAGPFTNTTYNLSGDVTIDLTINADDTVQGYINFTNYPYVSTLCGAGNFDGKKQGSNIEFTFISNDPDPGCGFDKGLKFTVKSVLTEDDSILSNGEYFISNGQRGIFRAISEQRVNGWIDLQPLREDYNAKRDSGRKEAAYAHQYLCIATRSRDEYISTGSNGWAGGFIKHLFEYMATHNKGKRGSDITCEDQLTDSGCFMKAGEHHIQLELPPGFADYCNKVSSDAEYAKWDTDHEAFLKNAVVPCLDEVHQTEGISSFITNAAKNSIPARAALLREMIQSSCRGFPGGGTAAYEIGSTTFPTLPLPLPQGALFQDDIASEGNLTVSVGISFFLPVTSSVQLQVLRQEADGSSTDLSHSSTGTKYEILSNRDVVTVTKDGLLTIKGTSSSFPNITPMLYILAKNGTDTGIGQFAITDSDGDGDLITDFYELQSGLNPKATNALNSDLDSDGLVDLFEVMINMSPVKQDTDNDRFDDRFENTAASDGRDPNCTPIFGCTSKLYLPLVRR